MGAVYKSTTLKLLSDEERLHPPCGFGNYCTYVCVRRHVCQLHSAFLRLTPGRLNMRASPPNSRRRRLQMATICRVTDGGGLPRCTSSPPLKTRGIKIQQFSHVRKTSWHFSLTKTKKTLGEKSRLRSIFFNHSLKALKISVGIFFS